MVSLSERKMIRWFNFTPCDSCKQNFISTFLFASFWRFKSDLTNSGIILPIKKLLFTVKEFYNQFLSEFHENLIKPEVALFNCSLMLMVMADYIKWKHWFALSLTFNRLLNWIFKIPIWFFLLFAQFLFRDGMNF